MVWSGRGLVQWYGVQWYGVVWCDVMCGVRWGVWGSVGSPRRVCTLPYFFFFLSSYPSPRSIRGGVGLGVGVGWDGGCF